MHTTPAPMHAGSRQAHYGFTLIELLVVITIIVVLLALLTPALDKAIYQAELAVCGARVKGLAQGATVYTANNKRRYPYRQVIDKGTGQPSRLSDSLGIGAKSDVFMLEGYTSLDNYNDPLSTDIDYATVDDADNAFANYSLWWSYFFAGHTAMNKVGQRFSWTSGVDGRVYRFNFLASDMDWVRHDDVVTYSSHPDADGILYEQIYDHRPIVEAASIGDQGVGALEGLAAFWFQAGDARYRGTEDHNYAFNDGSVHRYNNVRWNEWEHDDAQMVKVPEDDQKDDVSDYNHLPRN